MGSRKPEKKLHGRVPSEGDWTQVVLHRAAAGRRERQQAGWQLCAVARVYNDSCVLREGAGVAERRAARRKNHRPTRRERILRQRWPSRAMREHPRKDVPAAAPSRGDPAPSRLG